MKQEPPVLIANVRSGGTVIFDLLSVEGLARWSVFKADQRGEITGLTLLVKGIHYSFPLPKRFARVECDASVVYHRDGSGRIVGDEIAVHADEITATILCYRGGRPPMVRFTLERLGRPAFLPGQESSR